MPKWDGIVSTGTMDSPVVCYWIFLLVKLGLKNCGPLNGIDSMLNQAHGLSPAAFSQPIGLSGCRTLKITDHSRFSKCCYVMILSRNSRIRHSFKRIDSLKKLSVNM